MTALSPSGLGLRWALLPLLLATLLGACSSLLPKPVPLPARYVLDVAPASAANAGVSAAARPTPDNPPGAADAAPTLLVNTVHAAPGHDGVHMIYLRQPQQQMHFSQSEWAAPPARLLGPLVVTALQASPQWRAVVLAPSATQAELRLDLELLSLQHDFSQNPSELQLRLRASLVDTRTQRLLAWRELHQRSPAPSEDAYGGVLAARVATQAALAELLRFCEDAVQRWRSSQPPPAAAVPRSLTPPNRLAPSP